VRFLPCGLGAVLVELADAAERRRLDAALRDHPVAGVLEHVPAARTVLLHLAPGADPAAVVRSVRALDLRDAGAADAGSRPVEVPVRYDGEDLPEVATTLGMTPEEVVTRHTGQVWTVEFCGFAPGFGYLTGEAGGLDVPRRRDPRPRIPAGAVALADQYTGVYPRSSPGGWQLIGTTALAMWDDRREPPALLAPGTRVRFVVEGTA
jgi:KipI family sensor histidine kinase inhibitor